MDSLRPLLILSATITGNLIVAFAVRQGLLALGANEAVAGWTATAIWSVIATLMLTSIAVRLTRRLKVSASGDRRRPDASALR